MAAGTAFPLGLTVTPVRAHAPLLLRIISSILIITAFTIAIGVPLLLSGVTGFNLWQGEGVSMEPTFYEGDFVITRDVPASSRRAMWSCSRRAKSTSCTVSSRSRRARAANRR